MYSTFVYRCIYMFSIYMYVLYICVNFHLEIIFSSRNIWRYFNMWVAQKRQILWIWHSKNLNISQRKFILASNISIYTCGIAFRIFCSKKKKAFMIYFFQQRGSPDPRFQNALPIRLSLKRENNWRSYTPFIVAYSKENGKRSMLWRINNLYMCKYHTRGVYDTF